MSSFYAVSHEDVLAQNSTLKRVFSFLSKDMHTLPTFFCVLQ